jgi:Domain of unknown function (DUF4397)
MSILKKLIWASVPLAALAACGGGDTEDRLDVADPQVRFVHAAPSAPAVTLYRDAAAQPDATNTAFRFASNYFDVALSNAEWSFRTTVGGVTAGTVSIDPKRGNKYTIVAQNTSATATSAYLITDPYNKPLGSDSARVRLMHAAYNAGSVDVYLNAPGTDITPATITPLIASTARNTSGPAPGADSVDIPGGTYQLTVTAAGSKTSVFRGTVSFANNRDLLLIAVPPTSTTNTIRVLVKEEGVAGTTEVTPI